MPVLTEGRPRRSAVRCRRWLFVVLTLAVAGDAGLAGAQETALPGMDPAASPAIPLSLLALPRTVRSLAEDDRALAMGLIDLVNGFRDEIEAKKQRYLALLGDYGHLERLMEQGFQAEGADRWHRQVQMDMSSEGVPGFEDMAGKITPRWAVAPELVGPQGWECARPPVIEGPPDTAVCYEHEPQRWQLDRFEPEDAFIVPDYALLREQPPADTAGQGPPPRPYGEAVDMQARLGAFYDEHIFLLDRLGEAIGRDPDDEYSFLMLGIVTQPELGYGDDARIFESEAGQDRHWRLSPEMRDIATEIRDYLATARDRWRSYEALLSTAYPAFVARVYGRLAAIRQDYGRLQEPVFRRLLETYGSLSRQQLEGRYGRRSLDAIMDAFRADWRSQNLDVLGPLDAPVACHDRLRASLGALDEIRPAPTGTPHRLGYPVFANPLFLAIEHLPDGIAAGRDDWQLGAGFVQHSKGQTGGLAVAGPPAGLDRLPASGGLVLEPCALVWLRPQPTGALEVAETQYQRFEEDGAAAGAFP